MATRGTRRLQARIQPWLYRVMLVRTGETGHDSPRQYIESLIETDAKEAWGENFDTRKEELVNV